VANVAEGTVDGVDQVAGDLPIHPPFARRSKAIALRNSTTTFYTPFADGLPSKRRQD
jgi:hypothetical protein